MSNPTRPTGVPDNATAIPPSQGWAPIFLGSTLDPQYLAVQQFVNTLAHINGQANAVYVRAYSDWQQNAQQDAAYNLPVPPAPVAPPQRKANVVYAKPDGTVETVYGAGLWAYIWES